MRGQYGLGMATEAERRVDVHRVTVPGRSGQGRAEEFQAAVEQHRDVSTGGRPAAVGRGGARCHRRLDLHGEHPLRRVPPR